MAKTYIVTPNYTTRPPPTLQSVAKVPVSEGVNNISEAIAEPLTDTDVGTLFLGDVLRYPLGSELSVLNRIDRIKVPNHLLALPPDVKQGFRATRQSLLKGRVGVWASLLAALSLPLGIELGV
ncbi:hypothetical protein CPLU01_12633 [Colletotrichum plurivorum]|uniref:Uncharacterized protein n=1 Tax=Colletotrichum plurivorum TaxID=2175906 RepID=A0A8H6JXJ3_9PEZI|nr:hypothetical protein CPLU01_12633 [Colletotrichum plurivorum]